MSQQTERDRPVETDTGFERDTWRDKLGRHAAIFAKSKLAVAGIIILLFFTIMALLAPVLAPYEPDERIYHDDGTWASEEPPSTDHWLGTTDQGFDVFSQLVWGSQIAMFVGYLGAFMVIIISTTMGSLAGYYGGWVDEAITRLIDMLYGMPFIPTVIVLATIATRSIWIILAGIAMLYWLTPARVVRSEVLSLKERPYIEAAKANGASDRRILIVHIIPNILPLTALYGALAVAWSIAAEAGLSFLGFGDPNVSSWGVMLQRAFDGLSLDVWWWFFPPGISITLVVLAAFMVGRGYEEIVNPQLREA